jgi:O-antigen/teichoic acid export membrane protein
VKRLRRARAGGRDRLEGAEGVLVDTVALTPAMGMVPDPYDDGSMAREMVAAGPLAVGGVAANVLNIVATVLVARLLTSRQYGSVAQLLGLFFVLSMLGSALLVGVVRRIAQRAAAGQEAEAHRWTHRLYRTCALGVGAWCLVAVAVDLPLSRALRVPADGAVALTLMAGGVWVLLCIDRAILQVHRRYRSLGENLMVEIGVRTVLVLGFAAAGFGVPGYAVGLLIGELAAAGHARLRSERAWSYPADTDLERRTSPSARTLSYDLTAALAGFALIGVLQNADIILVGRLEPSSSGPYAAISVASKALVFGAILLGSYMLPETAIRWHRGEHALRQLAVTLVFLGIPTLVLLAAALVAPKQFLTVFFGARLATSASAFAPLVGAMACLGVTVLLTNYLFGAARRWIVGLLAAGVVVLIVLIHRAGGSIQGTARAELEVQSGLLVAVIVAFAATHLRFRPGRRPVPAPTCVDSVNPH